MRTIFVILIISLLAIAVAADGDNNNNQKKTCNKLVPPCASGVAPTVDNTTNCPSCQPMNCNSDRVQQCSKNMSASLPTCSDGTQPYLNSTTCCPSCVPRVVVCTKDKIQACQGLTLPTCANNTSPVFNSTSCCYSCSPAPPPPQLRPVDGKCNISQFQACVNSTSVCADGEEPSQNSSFSCCGSCVRPQRLCTKEAVAACRATITPCNGTSPYFLAGSCCPTCYIPFPRCNVSCPDGQMCVNRANDPVTGNATAPTCRNVTIANFLFNITDPGRRATIANLTCEQLADLFAEIVERFCDKNQNSVNCTAYAETINNLYPSFLTGAACLNSTNVTLNISDRKSVV